MAGRKTNRRGLTLAELLVAATIMLLIAAAVGTLASTVKSTNEYCQGYVNSAQHARVAISRIERAVTSAVANEQFPGCLVVEEQAGSQTLPHTLVVWYPATGSVQNPDGKPLISEIVVFSFDPAHPNQLIEIRSTSENAEVPAASDSSGWRSLTDRLKSSTTVTKTLLTDRLRVAPITGTYRESLSPSDLRGEVRFRRLMAPSDQEWSQFQSGLKLWSNWRNMAWPLDQCGQGYSPTGPTHRRWTGTRAIACQVELQIAPGSMASAASTAIPFYGSAMISYQLTYDPPF